MWLDDFKSLDANVPLLSWFNDLDDYYLKTTRPAMLAAQISFTSFRWMKHVPLAVFNKEFHRLCKEHQRHNNFTLDAPTYWDQYQIAVCNTDSVATAADGFEFFEALFESFSTRAPNLDGGISFPSIRKWQGELMDRETKLRQAGVLPAADPVVSYTKYFEGTFGPVPEHYFQKQSLPPADTANRHQHNPQQHRQRQTKKSSAPASPAPAPSPSPSPSSSATGDGQRLRYGIPAQEFEKLSTEDRDLACTKHILSNGVAEARGLHLNPHKGCCRMGKRVPGRKIEQCFSQDHGTNKCPLMAVVNYTRYDPHLPNGIDEGLEAFNEVELGEGTTCSSPVASSSSSSPSSLFTDDCLLTVGAVVVLLVAMMALSQPLVMQAHSLVIAPTSAPALRWVVASTAMMPVVAQAPCPTCAPFATVFSASAFGALVGVLVGVLVLSQRFRAISSPAAHSAARDNR